MIYNLKKIFIIVIFIFIISPCFSDQVYIFQSGDTLYSLSRKYGVSVSEIQRASGITDPTNIMIGTKIIIPDTSSSSYYFYTIQSGDTLYSLSRKNNASLEEIYSLNNLSETSILKIGMQIKIPNTGNTIQQNNVTYNSTQNNNYTQTNTNTDGIPYWPHPGRIEELSGELSKAVVIIGSEGDKVVSVSSGTVTWAGPFRGYGKMVFIKCSNGYVFGYGGHEELFVDTGDTISIGTEIGTLGINSHDGIAKVFFFVAKNGIPLRPDQVPRS
jgi:lipoprotein YgeR